MGPGSTGLTTDAILFVAAALAGALNSVAGGGSFISFPALLFSGIAPVSANATNTVALWPAGVASAYAYRNEARQAPDVLVAFSIASVLGGVAGAALLLHTRDVTFVRLLPYLLLLATLVFTFGTKVAARLRSRAGRGTNPNAALAGATLVQFVISIYGGYFGGGVGIMMLATLSILGMTNIHAMNGVKALLNSLINGVAVIAFVIAGAVDWRAGILMVVGGTFGGFAGANLARRIDPARVKGFVLLFAWSLTSYFFFRAYRAGTL